jgi:chromosome partitioning protein
MAKVATISNPTRTLAILSRKGGAGKTTVALHLAVAAQAAGRRVALVDMDPQRSAAEWWRSRAAPTPELVEVDAGGLAPVVKAAKADRVGLLVIDTRPSAEADALEAATVADLAVLVVKPSILDLRAVAATVETVKRSRTPGLILLNQAPPARGDHEAAITREARAALAGYGLPVVPVVLHGRAAYHSALIDGRAVNELEPHGKASAEVAALWRYLEGELWRSARA